MLRAWEIARLEKELAERSREKQNKEGELEIELDHYKQEAKKIPNICLQKPCYFDLMNDGERDKEFVFAIAKQMCPQICPKWNGGGQDGCGEKNKA